MCIFVAYVLPTYLPIIQENHHYSFKALIHTQILFPLNKYATFYWNKIDSLSLSLSLVHKYLWLYSSLTQACTFWVSPYLNGFVCTPGPGSSRSPPSNLLSLLVKFVLNLSQEKKKTQKRPGLAHFKTCKLYFVFKNHFFISSKTFFKILQIQKWALPRSPFRSLFPFFCFCS